MPQLKCQECEDKLSSEGSYSSCGKCRGKFHFKCAGISESTWKTKGSSGRKLWRCSSCRKSKQATEDADSEVETSGNESMAGRSNMSGIEELILLTKKEILAKIVALDKKVEDLTQINKNYERKIKYLGRKFCELEKKSVENNIEIVGLKQVNNKKIEDTVCEMFNEVKIELKSEDIENIEKVIRKRNEKETEIIVVKLKNKSMKENIIKKKKVLYEKKKEIFVQDQLTPYLRKLLWQAKSKGNELNYKYIWCQHGNILMRKLDGGKIIQITDEEDLKNLK